jgi:hypothetical protein
VDISHALPKEKAQLKRYNKRWRITTNRIAEENAMKKKVIGYALTIALIAAMAQASEPTRLEREIDSVAATEAAASNPAHMPESTATGDKKVIVIKENKDTVFILNTASPSKCVHDVRASLDTSRR